MKMVTMSPGFAVSHSIYIAEALLEVAIKKGDKKAIKAHKERIKHYQKRLKMIEEEG